MKKRNWIARIAAVAFAVCCLCIGGTATAVKAKAEETQGYEWGTTECISIAPPYSYSSYGTVAFQVFFDKDVTTTNYKHLAAGTEALKTFGKYDIPNMTPAIIDSLDESGVFDSMNDCISFNGKKVRELQAISPLACMIHAGELGANNSINIELNGMVPEVKITDMAQPFTLTFHEGLKFPSGVEVKETVTWVYDPMARTFQQSKEAAPDETGFTVFYNGQKISKENNLVMIYDRDAFNLDFLTVQTESMLSSVEIEPQFTTLQDGYNYVLITCKAENAIDFEHIQIVFHLVQTEEVTSGCGGVISSACGAIVLLAGCAIFIKRGKQA